MELRQNTVFIAVFNATVGRRAAIDLGAVLVISRLALLGLKAVPIKRNSSKVEVLFKFFSVSYIILLIFKFVKHKNVSTVFEIMRGLIYFYRFSDKGLAVFVLKAKLTVALSVFFYIFLCSALEQFLMRLCPLQPQIP